MFPPDHKNSYNPNHLHAIMAGNGDPYAVLTPLRKQLLRALHDREPGEKLLAHFDLNDHTFQEEMRPLIRASLVASADGRYRPAFLIVDRAETQRVFAHAHEIGKQLGDFLLPHWKTLQHLYGQLEISRRSTFQSLAFFLVGSIVLDVGLLLALANDRSLMPPKPHRPGPGNPGAHYYFWMIEGDWDQLGRFGQRARALAPWPHWLLITYGQYKVNGVLNTLRDQFEKAAMTAAEEKRAVNPQQLALQMKIPLFEKTDSEKWVQGTETYTRHLVDVYRKNEEAIRGLYATLRASSYLGEGFGEFFCWYDHIAYASAIEHLAHMGVLEIPQERFIGILWHEVTEEDY